MCVAVDAPLCVKALHLRVSLGVFLAPVVFRCYYQRRRTAMPTNIRRGHIEPQQLRTCTSTWKIYGQTFRSGNSTKVGEMSEHERVVSGLGLGKRIERVGVSAATLEVGGGFRIIEGAMWLETCIGCIKSMQFRFAPPRLWL